MGGWFNNRYFYELANSFTRMFIATVFAKVRKFKQPAWLGISDCLSVVNRNDESWGFGSLKICGVWWYCVTEIESYQIISSLYVLYSEKCLWIFLIICIAGSEVIVLLDTFQNFLNFYNKLIAFP